MVAVIVRFVGLGVVRAVRVAVVSRFDPELLVRCPGAMGDPCQRAPEGEQHGEQHKQQDSNVFHCRSG